MAKRKINKTIEVLIPAFEDHENTIHYKSDILTFINAYNPSGEEALFIADYIKYSTVSNYDLAIVAIMELEKSVGKMSIFHYEKALCYHQLKLYNQALTEIEAALKINSTIKFLTLRAKLYLRFGRFDESLNDCMEVLNKSENIYCRLIRATCNYSLGKYESSLEDYKFLFQNLGADCHKLSIAQCLEKLDRIDEAISYYQGCINLNDEDGYEANIALAKLSYARSEYQLCIKYSSNAMSVSPKEEEPYYCRAKAKIELGYDASEDIDRYSEYSINESNVLLLKCYYFIKKEDYENLLIVANLLINDSEFSFCGHFGKGIVQHKRKDYAGALASYTSSINLSDQEDTRILRAKVYIDLKNYRLANEDALRALEIVLEYADAYYIYGKVLFNSKKADLGFENLSKAIKLGTKEGEAYYLRGIIYLNKGNEEAGLLDLSKAGELGYAEAYKTIEAYQNNPQEFRKNGFNKRRDQNTEKDKKETNIDKKTSSLDYVLVYIEAIKTLKIVTPSLKELERVSGVSDSTWSRLFQDPVFYKRIKEALKKRQSTKYSKKDETKRFWETAEISIDSIISDFLGKMQRGKEIEYLPDRKIRGTQIRPDNIDPEIADIMYEDSENNYGGKERYYNDEDNHSKRER